MQNTQTLRDTDELEGALLLPVATRVDGPTHQADDAINPNIAVAAGATPTTYFDYDTAVLQEDHDRQQAITIPLTSSQVPPGHKERYALCKGQQMAVIAAEEEREAIRNANRKVYSKDYHAQQAAKAANSHAKIRDREERRAVRDPYTSSGHELQLLEHEPSVARTVEPPTSAEFTTSDAVFEQQQRPGCHESGYQVGGYQIGEYQIGSYETKDYKVAEYKSVYD